MTPIQKLVLDRLADGNLSYREAASRSNGLISHATLNQIALGKYPLVRVNPRTVRGLALALDVKVSEVESELLKSGGQAPTEFKLPKKADKLSAAQRKAVLAFVDALLEQSG